MIFRKVAFSEAIDILNEFPVLGIIGPRQIGKTTLAKELIKKLEKPAIYLDLESLEDAEVLSNAEFFFKSHEDKTIIIDEVQRDKRLFPILRSVIDRKRVNARFILLGSASPDLIRDTSESLAGRVAYIELTGLNLVEFNDQPKLWLKGGYPILHSNKQNPKRWFTNYINTYIEKDLPQLGLTGQSVLIKRLTYMVASLNGELLNYASISKSLELSTPTIKKYLNLMEGAFLIRTLSPYHINAKKRLIKSPKIYLRDSGLLNNLVNLNSIENLMVHPKVGQHWEGFVIEQIYQLTHQHLNLYFYRTTHGAEVDLVLVEGITPIAVIEIKYGANNKPSKGNNIAADDLDVKHKYLVHANSDSMTWENKKGWVVCSLTDFLATQLSQFL